MRAQNNLHLADALQWLPTLPDKSVHALITDPPYSSGGATTAARQQAPSVKYIQTPQLKKWADFHGDNRDQRSQLQWMMLWLLECHRILKEGAVVCLFTDWRQLPLTTDALQCANFIWRGVIAWDKTEGVRPQMARPRAQCEYIVWGSKGNLLATRDAPIIPGAYRESVKQADKHHLTGKPTNLMRQLVRICEKGGTIIDPFAGSGTTLVAAKLEGFNAIGCEKSEHYWQVAQERLASLDASLLAVPDAAKPAAK